MRNVKHGIMEAKQKEIELKNPFLVYGYVSPRYFCDREEETEKMISALNNERNLTLIAPRRIGKTGLIKNVFYLMEQQDEEVACFYMDIFATRDLSAFVRLLAKTVIPTISLDFVQDKSEQTLKEIFDYMAASGRSCYLAIDDFQQITTYPEKGAEALLRSYIQFLPNVHFIFAGSSRHLMEEMFTSAKRPFYQSTQLLVLDQINETRYYQFASIFFENKGRKLAKEVFQWVYARFEGHTWYMQAMLNRLYEKEVSVTEIRQAEIILADLLEENASVYQNLIAMLTDNQLLLMQAIAKERKVLSPNSGEFIKRYGLKTPSSVSTALKSLLEKELVYKSANGYMVYDRFMGLWLQTLP